MTEDRDIAEKTSTVTPVRAEMTDASVVYRYQSEPISGLIAAVVPADKHPKQAALNLLADTRWATN